MRWSPSISEPPSNTTPPPLLRQPSDKEQLKLKAKQKGEQAHYKILKSCQQWLQKSCCSTHQSRGKVTDLWIWGQSYLSLLSPKGSTASDCLDVVQSKKKTQTDWRQGRLKCTQHVLMLPTNLHRPLPWRRCRRAGRPPFLVTCPPIRGRVWSHSSLCLETSGPRLPQRCDECHTQSRSLNLRGKESKTHIIVCVVHSLKWRCCVRTPDTRNSLAWWMDDQGKMQS